MSIASTRHNYQPCIDHSTIAAVAEFSPTPCSFLLLRHRLLSPFNEPTTPRFYHLQSSTDLPSNRPSYSSSINLQPTVFAIQIQSRPSPAPSQACHSFSCIKCYNAPYYAPEAYSVLRVQHILPAYEPRDLYIDATYISTVTTMVFTADLVVTPWPVHTMRERAG